MARTVKRLIEIASAEIGYLEKASNSQLDDKIANAGHNNWTKYARDLYNAGYYNGNKNGYAWCDVFVDWCFYILCNKDANKAQEITCQTGPYGAGCQESRRYYKNKERLFKDPKPGDQIFLCWNGNDYADHTGIVYKVDSTKVYTIEGNASDKVSLVDYYLNSKSILGYGRPYFEGDTGELSYELPGAGSSEAASAAVAIAVTELIPNAFSLNIVSLLPTKATIEVKIDTQPASTWSYILTNIKTKASSDAITIGTSVDKINVTALYPHTPYTLQVLANDGLSTVTKQIFFSTPSEYPTSVTSVKLSFKDSTQKELSYAFNSPKTWSTFGGYKNKGYRISFFINGALYYCSDSLISDTSSSAVKATIKLADIFTKDFAQLPNSIQVGVQTWLEDNNNIKFFDAQTPVMSNILYTDSIIKYIDKAYVKVANDFKRVVLYSNE
jgi:hypothetical protein